VRDQLRAGPADAGSALDNGHDGQEGPGVRSAANGSAGDKGRDRRVREDGARSRRTILDAAAELATVEGLDGLSIARLAKKAGISKSGLFAHFGSKENLQLATIDAAWQTYQRQIIEPALRRTDPLARLRALCEGFLSLIGGDLFPGGCFFASATTEFDTRPGPVLTRLIALNDQWRQGLSDQIAAARTAGLLTDTIEPDQAVFDLNAYLHLANELYVLHHDPAYLDRARHSIDAYLRQPR
jgi:AcrR family transcriptional regulator